MHLINGNNIVADNMKPQQITGIREYRDYSLSLTKNFRFAESYIKVVNSLPVYRGQSALEWTNHFADYGTHILKSAFMGGSVSVIATKKAGRASPIEDASSNVANVIKIIKLILENVGETSGSSDIALSVPDWTFELSFSGGDNNIPRPQMHNLFSKKGKHDFNKWLESIKIHPALLLSEISLEHIYEFLKVSHQEASKRVSFAANSLFCYAGLGRPSTTYIPWYMRIFSSFLFSGRPYSLENWNLFARIRKIFLAAPGVDKQCDNKPQRIFLFLGIEGSGRSTAIKKIFNVTNIIDLDKDVEKAANQPFPMVCSGDKLQQNVRLIEWPGFKSSICGEENDYISLSLSVLLKRLDIVPEYIFITARLNDDRFMGDRSEFSNALKIIKSLEDTLTKNSDWSIIVLLLTHGDRPDAKSSLLQRISAYEEILNHAFEIEPKRIVLHMPGMDSEEISELIINKQWVDIPPTVPQLDNSGSAEGNNNEECTHVDGKKCEDMQNTQQSISPDIAITHGEEQQPSCTTVLTEKSCRENSQVQSGETSECMDIKDLSEQT